jgi:hypothetical protein
VTAMRSLFAAALGLLAAITQSPAAGSQPETLYARPGGTIAAFAQDGPLISWLAPKEGRCNRVHVLSLQNGLQVKLPLQGSAHNVTCLWPVVQPVGLAVASDNSDVLWTLHDRAPLPFDYLIGAGAGDRRERRFHEIARTSSGAGLWLGGIAGDGSTLLYAVTSVDYVDEAGCLAGTGSCAMEITGGGVYRIVGRQPPKYVPGTGGAVEVAAAGDTVAYVPATIAKKGQLTSSADEQVSVVDVTDGSVVARVTPQGSPLAVALAHGTLATLERTPLGVRLAWYETATGHLAGSVSVPVATSPELSVSDRLAVYRVGRTVHAVNLTTSRDRAVVKTASEPVGLSLEGTRLAWAENLKSGGRVRALYLKP